MDRDSLTFLRTLTDDIQWALDNLAANNTPTARRNVLRTLISAAEGISWTYRMYVMSVARHFDAVTPLMELALAEASYSVTEGGKLIEQARHISMPAIIRLTTAFAQSICSDISVDFGSDGWMAFKQAIKARHRITHPKTASDLFLAPEEVAEAQRGFFWFSDMSISVMEEITKAAKKDILSAKEFLEKMALGDPDTIALYERAHRDLEL